MGIILEAQVSFSFSLLCILFQISFRCWPFSNPTVVEETSIEKALNANECVRWIEAFIANLGHPLWGSQSMQELASLMRKGRKFLIPNANSCIDWEPHKWCPRFAMNASIHLTHSFAFSAFSMEVSSTTVGFLKECIKAKNERHLCLQNYTHKIVHSSAMHYQNLNVIHKPSKKV